MKAVCFKLSVLCWREAFIVVVLTYLLFIDGIYSLEYIFQVGKTHVEC